MSAFPRVRLKIEGHISLRIDSETGGRYLAIPPRSACVRAFTTVQGTGCGTEEPTAGVAIVCGAVSGLIVLDVDPRNGGGESLHDRAVPAGPSAQTGGEGWHYLMAVGRERVGKITGLLPGVDLQGEGSYIVAPPSLHPSGRRYAWCPGRALGEVPLPPIPFWLRRIIRDHQRQLNTPSGVAGGAVRGNVEAVLGALSGVRRTPRGWVARCPAHEDLEPSLSVGLGRDGRVLFHCFAGCHFSQIRQALAAVGAMAGA